LLGASWYTGKNIKTFKNYIKYFELEASIFGVKTSPSIESTETENKIQLSSTNFQDRKY